MRNLLFALALGIASIVHFTHQIFPNRTALAPSPGLVEGLDSTPYLPPADWLPQPTPGEAIRPSSACIDSAPLAARHTVSLQGPPPGCLDGTAVNDASYRGF